MRSAPFYRLKMAPVKTNINIQVFYELNSNDQNIACEGETCCRAIVFKRKQGIRQSC